MSNQTPARPSFFSDERFKIILEHAHKFYETYLKYRLHKDAFERTESVEVVHYYDGQGQAPSARPRSVQSQRQAKRL